MSDSPDTAARQAEDLARAEETAGAPLNPPDRPTGSRTWQVSQRDGWDTAVTVEPNEHILVVQQMLVGTTRIHIALRPTEAEILAASLLSAVNQHREWSA